ncbi:MAG TPA: hypothetical protein VIU15_47990 [Streptomyces sp.]
MPPEFAAFCLSRYDVYLAYATARVGDRERARLLVQASLGDLAMVWPEALESASPSALAWRLLAARTGCAVAGWRGGGPHRVLPAAQADAWLLRYRLGLTPQRAAEAMGRTPGEFETLLKKAVRTGAAA